MGTSKDSLHVHAKRLREMAAYEQAKAEEWERHSVAPVSPCGYSSRGCAQASQNCAATAASLLAGAAALEALELAKGALRQIASGQSWNPTRDAAEELARLEGL